MSNLWINCFMCLVNLVNPRYQTKFFMDFFRLIGEADFLDVFVVW